jgi:hypothetical protein
LTTSVLEVNSLDDGTGVGWRIWGRVCREVARRGCGVVVVVFVVVVVIVVNRMSGFKL